MDDDKAGQRLTDAIHQLMADIDELKSVAEPGTMPSFVANAEAQFINLLTSQNADKPSIRRRRLPSLTSALKQAAKTGTKVSSAVIEDGKITLKLGEATGEKPDNELDEWIKKHAH